MSIKKSIPYLSSDYNNILEDFQIEKIRSMGKEELIVCLKNPESWIYDFYLRNSCINLFQRTGGFTGIGLCDDDLYRIGVETTIIQLNKRYFFDLNNDNFLILNKIRSRIVNNIRNYFSPVRRINYTQFNNYLIQIEDSDNTFEKIALEKKSTLIIMSQCFAGAFHHLDTRKNICVMGASEYQKSLSIPIKKLVCHYKINEDLRKFLLHGLAFNPGIF